MLTVTLTGCTGGSYSADTADTLQHGVLAVAQAASANDLAGAQGKLTALEKLNDTAFGKGRISRSRHDAVAASITVIRADLSHLQDQAEQARLQEQLQQLQQQQAQQQQQQKQQQEPQKGKGKGKNGDGG